MLLTVAKHNLAIGGEWFLPEDKQDAARILKEHQASMVADYRAGVDRVIGVFASNGNRAGAVYSGALACAQIVPNAVIVEHLAEDRVWAAAIRDGVPLNNHDLVCDQQQAQQVLTDMLSFNPSATIIGNWSGATRSVESVLNDLNSAQWKKSRLQPPRRTRFARMLLWVLIAAGVTIGGVVALALFDQMSKHNAQAAKIAAMRQSEEEKAAAQRKLQMRWHADADVAIARQKAEFLTGVPASSAIDSVRVFLHVAAKPQNGFRADKMTCSVDDKACRVSWASWMNYGSPLRATGLPKAPTALPELLSDNVTAMPEAFNVPPVRIGLADQVAALAFASFGKTYQIPGFQLSPTRKEVKVTLPLPPPGLEKPDPIVAPVLGHILEWQFSAPLHVILASRNALSGQGVRVSTIDATFGNSTSPATLRVSGQLLVE